MNRFEHISIDSHQMSLGSNPMSDGRGWYGAKGVLDIGIQYIIGNGHMGPPVNSK